MNLLVRHKVKDFATWKPFFDADEKNRKGVFGKTMLSVNAKDKNEIFIFFEVLDMAKAKAFGESKELKEIMMKAGVIDKPDMWWLESAKM